MGNEIDRLRAELAKVTAERDATVAKWHEAALQVDVENETMLSRWADKHHDLRRAARALVDALPKCYECVSPGTVRMDRRDVACDEHGGEFPTENEGDVPHAPALRALVALLGPL